MEADGRMTAEDFIVAAGLDTVDAAIICDTGVSGDDVLATMLGTGLWRLSNEVRHVAGKRIRTLVPVGDDDV